MTSKNLLILLIAVWGLVTLSLSHMLEPDLSKPNLEYAPDMVHSPDQDAYEPTDLFDDGRTLRASVAGTIPRGFKPFAFAADEAGMKKAGKELKSPVEKPDPATLSRGAAAYQAKCSACHGAGGAGDGEVTKRGVPPPPSLLGEGARKLADGEVYHIITLGRKNMPAHGALVSREDRWSIIAWLRDLQGDDQ